MMVDSVFVDLLATKKSLAQVFMFEFSKFSFVLLFENESVLLLSSDLGASKFLIDICW